MTALCLVLTVLLTAAALGLFGQSIRRRNSLHGLAAMTVMLVAGVPAVFYGALTS